MFDADKYIQEYEELEHGKPRLRVMKQAIAAADEAKDASWQIMFRHEYLNESVFECDDIDGIIVFPEMLSIFDEHPELTDEYLLDVMWDFKNILGESSDFPQISLAELENLYAEYERRLKKYGFSLRTLKYKRERLSERTGNFLPLSEYGKYKDEPTDSLKDCEACETNWNVICALMNDDEAKAEELSQPLFDGTLSCAEVPNATYFRWITYLQKKGDYQKAKKYAKRLSLRIRDTSQHTDYAGVLLRFYAKFQPHTGRNLLRRTLANYLSCRNPMLKLKYAKGAYSLFKECKDEDFMLILPPEFPLYNAENNYITAEVRDYFYNEAKTLAQRFDERNGNTVQMDDLNADMPDYDDEAVDIIHGDASQDVSAMAAVCSTLPQVLTLESVQALIKADGHFEAELMRTDEEHGFLQFQLREDDRIYQAIVMVQQVPDLDDFRPATPISRVLREEADKAEGVVLCLMPFEDHQPDLALHFQMRFLHMICPDAVVYLDYTRRKVFHPRWFAMQTETTVPPLVDYLYNLDLFGCENDRAWIFTRGMTCCSLREFEIWDANRENVNRYCDLLCFVVERFLLRGEIVDAGEPFEALRLSDNTSLRLAWLPASQAKAYYENQADSILSNRTQIVGDEAEEMDKNAVLFLYCGENEDGSAKLKTLGTLTEEDFEKFRYGQYIATGRKVAALAKERYGIFMNCFAEYPEEAYVNVHAETDEDEDDIWMKVTEATEDAIKGTLTDECIVGEEGAEYTASPCDLLDFTIHHHDISVSPNLAYLGEL